ncbi:ribose-phosphate diphosphokinase [Nannocystis pusilla]|uniref:ribose-phosphate diphosphokinase n=1 Tax=Nannocystis pusilla TaxID=889268 RepID=A0ABS7U106_9BACT|nr:ribose-phosphate diphosphokinase [Nannocystis pusilla]MBZ5714126.1 ribose-phosphate diphosphokinase [Nannocystis pusilla]
MTTRPLVFATPEYGYLQAALCGSAALEPGEIDTFAFPDGERYLRLVTPVAGRDVVLIGGSIDDAAALTLFDLACGAVHYGARRLTLIIPYYGYATMERAARPGEVVTAKTRAALFSAIPPASYGNRVILLDLHAEGIPHYFEAGLVATHVYAKPVIRDMILDIADGRPFVLACTDAGRAKWVESLANDLGVTAAFVFKRRHDGERTEITAIDAQVAGKPVILYDDMIRTGGSLIGAARAYQRAGAVSLAAVATHGVFPGDALQRLQATGLFSAIACTDSHPRARALAGDDAAAAPPLRVASIAPLLAPFLAGHVL